MVAFIFYTGALAIIGGFMFITAFIDYWFNWW